MKPRTEAKRAAEAIVADLCDRRGLKDVWAEMDSRTRREIRDEWARLIQRSFGKGTTEPPPSAAPPQVDPRQSELF